MDHNVHKLAACSVALSALVIGCTPATQSHGLASVSATTPKPARDAARFSEQAQAEVQKGKFGQALTFAERAVEASPRDVGYRMLLGDVYLKNGRFASAETSFSDVTALDPGNVRGTLSLALSLIAQGKSVLATAQLDKLEGTAAPGDLGLAYALAGQHDRARSLLESAANAPGATGRVRQNLALAYALAGDWKNARTTAAQDLPAGELNARLEHWASLATPSNSYAQVSALLGVTAVEDGGQPVRLALTSPEPSPVAYAEAPAAAPTPVAPAPVEVALAPTPVSVPAPPVSVPAPVVVAQVAPEPVAVLDAPVQFAAAAADLVQSSAIVAKAALTTTVPLPAFKPARVTKLGGRTTKSGAGRFVVQIGAYRNLSQASRAWGDATRQYGLAGDKQAQSTTVTLPGRGTFYRLSIAPFEAPAEAARVCGSIRARGGACFVRSVAGDAPLQYALRARNTRGG